MKKAFALWAASAAMACCEDAAQVLPESMTVGGKEFTGVAFVRAEPSGIVVTHSKGMARWRFADLPEDIRKAFGFDPAAAAEHERAQRAAMAQRNAAIDAAMAAQAAAKEAERLEAEKAPAFQPIDGNLVKRYWLSKLEPPASSLSGDYHKIMKQNQATRAKIEAGQLDDVATETAYEFNVRKLNEQGRAAEAQQYVRLLEGHRQAVAARKQADALASLKSEIRHLNATIGSAERELSRLRTGF